jgi:hypothetical protein
MEEHHPLPHSPGLSDPMQPLETASVGHLLVRLSSVGFALIAFALLGFGLLWHATGLGGERVEDANALMAGMLAVNAPLAVTSAWLLYRVREVGIHLRGTEPMSTPLGLAFWNLRNALVVTTAVGFICGSLEPVIGASHVSYSINFEFGTLILGAIATVMAHGVAKLVMRATRLREDAEGFV